MRDPLTRGATAAAPLMRCSDPAVVTATEQQLNALSDGEGTARLEAALEAFGRAVSAATAPPAVLVGTPSCRAHGLEVELVDIEQLDFDL
ncbi:hypothetical protein AB0F36_35425 [Streptomyces sp. NPDC029080]|uniref:hypothetical protein n=1 Tax=Streptomyces sp. NPDC029080 TaxID=3155017 RepID=UPI0033E1DABE